MFIIHFNFVLEEVDGLNRQRRSASWDICKYIDMASFPPLYELPVLKHESQVGLLKRAPFTYIKTIKPMA